MNSFPESASVDANAAQLDNTFQVALSQLQDSNLSDGQRNRLRQIAGDIAKTAGTLALAVAIVLPLAGGAIASESGLKQGLPGCLNSPDRNGAERGCGA